MTADVPPSSWTRLNDAVTLFYGPSPVNQANVDRTALGGYCRTPGTGDSRELLQRDSLAGLITGREQEASSGTPGTGASREKCKETKHVRGQEKRKADDTCPYPKKGR